MFHFVLLLQMLFSAMVRPAVTSGGKCQQQQGSILWGVTKGPVFISGLCLW